ncbi:hypothetical protein RJ639_020636, partial [Escallonia herrerae]
GLVPGGSLKPIDVDPDTTCDVTEYYWFPMLAGLSDLTSDPRPEVRNCALEVLFDLLNERGSKFSSSFWESIFHRVLFPIFDHVRHAGKENLVSSGDEWLRETSIHSLQLLCNLFNAFYKEVCFMLPSLLSLLLDCAKKTDQSVVSISLAALVHLIEVGGHQFSDSDWDTLLKSIRDASYTTQPLELLNALGFENPHHTLLRRDLEVPTGDSPYSMPVDSEWANTLQHTVSEKGNTNPRVDISSDVVASNHNRSIPDHNHNLALPIEPENSQGLHSPSGRAQKHADDGNLQRTQTIGQRFMGNMMDNLFVKSFTSKSKHPASDVVASSPVKFSDAMDAMEPDAKDADESLILGTIRSKCITQLLLLDAIDSIQKKYWTKLKAPQKITIMDILFSVLEFAASYNSYANLRFRMRHIPAERPPLNLLRQELAGTCIYLDVLQKSTAGNKSNREEKCKPNVSQELDSGSGSVHYAIAVDSEEGKLEGIAEEKLVSFCGQVLREASEFQSNIGETTNMDIHRVLELRSPIIVKVLKGMCFMNNQIFRNHLREFYPVITKLVCCDQMDVRGALADLFRVQLHALMH